MDNLLLFAQSFFYLFIIMDPLASIPVFLSLTKNNEQNEMKKIATNAVIIAGIIAFAFLLIGSTLLDLTRVTLTDLKIVGGIILVLLGLESVLGFDFSTKDRTEAAAILIATPLLTGPGLLTAITLSAQEYGFSIVALALGLVLLVSWVILYNAVLLKRICGMTVINITSKVFGILIMAVGVSYLRTSLGF
jgi:multiple antibiotic resistance protein